MADVQSLERPHTEELASQTEAEEGDVGDDQSLHVECVDVLGWALRCGEQQVGLEQSAHVLGTGVVDGDLSLGHDRNLMGPGAFPGRPRNSPGIVDQRPWVPEPLGTTMGSEDGNEEVLIEA